MEYHKGIYILKGSLYIRHIMHINTRSTYLAVPFIIFDVVHISGRMDSILNSSDDKRAIFHYIIIRDASVTRLYVFAVYTSCLWPLW